jgi:hypothetical protein
LDFNAPENKIESYMKRRIVPDVRRLIENCAEAADLKFCVDAFEEFCAECVIEEKTSLEFHAYVLLVGKLADPVKKVEVVRCFHELFHF